MGRCTRRIKEGGRRRRRKDKNEAKGRDIRVVRQAESYECFFFEREPRNVDLTGSEVVRPRLGEFSGVDLGCHSTSSTEGCVDFRG